MKYTQTETLKNSDGHLSADDCELLQGLIGYWKHQHQLLQGFEKNKEKLQENSKIIEGWIADIEDCVGKARQ